MSVARSDDGPGNVTRRRGPRKPPDIAIATPVSSSPSTATGPGARLDDLYRLPMPKLFALAEREGIAEHTGMNRGQLIVAIVRRQIERGEVVRGSGTLEVLPDGYGFLRSAAHNYLASPEDIYVSPSQIRRLGLRTGLYFTTEQGNRPPWREAAHWVTASAASADEIYATEAVVLGYYAGDLARGRWLDHWRPPAPGRRQWLLVLSGDADVGQAPLADFVRERCQIRQVFFRNSGPKRRDVIAYACE